MLRSLRTGSSYVGIAKDPARRVLAHNGVRGARDGAKRTRAERPWVLAMVRGPWPSRAAAQRTEAAVKRRRGLYARLAALELRVPAAPPTMVAPPPP